MTEQEKKKKIGNKVFLVIILVAIAGVYLHQRKGITLRGWGDDIKQGFTDAKSGNKVLVVFFTRKPPSDVARKIAKRTTMTENRKLMLESGKYVPVYITTSLGSDMAKKYKLTKLPTLIAFHANGKERNRHEGNIGEVPFRADFLENKGKNK